MGTDRVTLATIRMLAGGGCQSGLVFLWTAPRGAEHWKLAMSLYLYPRSTFARWSSFLVTLLSVTVAPGAHALLELQPFESFVCEGDACTPDFARTGGNGGQVNGRELKSRSTGALFQTDEDPLGAAPMGPYRWK